MWSRWSTWNYFVPSHADMYDVLRAWIDTWSCVWSKCQRHALPCGIMHVTCKSICCPFTGAKFSAHTLYLHKGFSIFFPRLGIKFNYIHSILVYWQFIIRFSVDFLLFPSTWLNCILSMPDHCHFIVQFSLSSILSSNPF